MPELLTKINSLTNTLKIADYKDDSLKKRVFDQINIINEKLEPKQNELSTLINKIIETESKAAKRLSNVNPEDLAKLQNQSGNSFNSDTNLNTEEDEKKFPNRGSFRESKLFVQDIQSNMDFLQKRQEELEEIKKISGQVKEITVAMKEEVKTQGEKLNQAEDLTKEAKDNAIKAELEIQEAEQMTQGNSKKIWIVVIIVVLAVVGMGIALAVTLT
jgi:hypothetical protein